MPLPTRLLIALAFGLAACAGAKPQHSYVAVGTITRAIVPPGCGVIAFAGLLEIELTQAPTGYAPNSMLVVVRCMGDSEAVQSGEPIEGRRVRFNVALLDTIPQERRYGMYQVPGEVQSDLPLYGLTSRGGAEEFQPEWVGP